MELERNWGPKRTVPGLHGSSNSKSTLHTKGTGAPSRIPSIRPENDVGPQKGTFIRKENDVKYNTNYGLSKERVNQAQGSPAWESQGPERVKNPPGNRGGGDSSGETSGNQKSSGEGGDPPRRNGKQGEGDDDPDPSDDCLLYTSPSPRDATLSRMPSSA